MKKAVIFLFSLILILFIWSSCTKKADETAESSKIKIKTIEGVPHVYNPAEPLKGIVTLELEKVTEIDSLKIDANQPPSIGQYLRSPDKIYLCDSSQARIYIFDTQGKELNVMDVKGEGPGEFEPFAFRLQINSNDLWLPGERKIARYSSGGKYLEEIKFQRAYRIIEILDENRFIGKYFISYPEEQDKSKQKKLFCTMFNRQGTDEVTYLEDFEAGGILVTGTLPGGQVIRVNFALPSVSPDIVHRIDHQRQMVYLCLSKYYTVYLKNLAGKTLRVIHREHENKALSEADRTAIVNRILYRQPPEVKKVIGKNLPARFCAIFNLQPLPRGFLAVYRLTGPQVYDIDVFDPEGQYIYQLKLPGNISYIRVRFYQQWNLISLHSSIDERDIYREYRVKNLSEIFGN
jgi:hypothetical protein